MSAEATLPTISPGRRWDPIVKVTHWSIALAVLANAVITEDGSSAHVWVGYMLAGILSLRLVWGLTGPPEARFSAFPPSPTRVLGHVRDIAAGRHVAHRSHNPVGALMVYAIWGCLMVIIGTGIGMAGLPGDGGREHLGSATATQGAFGAAPEDDDGHERAQHREAREGEEEEGPLGEVHEAAANLLYVLILLHLAGVLFESRRSSGRLVAAMLPGKR